MEKETEEARSAMRTLRIWKLGSLEHKIFPTEKAVAKLAELLMNEEATDIIWGPELTHEKIEISDDDVIVITNHPGFTVVKDGDKPITIKEP